jgi:hypothetical protein
VERSAIAIDCCRKVFRCFGLPSVDVNTVFDTLKRTIFDDMGGNLLTTFAEGIAGFGALAAIASFGGSVIAAGTINAALVPPSTCRFYLIVACDLILILVRCFHEALLTKTGQPTERELQRQCREYRFSGMPVEVHKRVKRLLPLDRVNNCFKKNKVRKGIEDIVRENREQIVNRMTAAANSMSSRGSSLELKYTMIEGDLTSLAEKDVDLLN